MNHSMDGAIKIKSYYTVGVIKKFEARANRKLTLNEWKAILNERLDVSCFELKYDEKLLIGSLRKGIFENYIDDLYVVFHHILGERRNGKLDYYNKEYGKNHDEDQTGWTAIELTDKEGLEVVLHFEYKFLFTEEKERSDRFSAEPVLLNWLFRNSTLDNKLAGCIISDRVKQLI